MTYIHFVFVGEGKADYDFLLEVVVRTIQKLAPTADLQDPEAVAKSDLKGNGTVEKMLELAQKFEGYSFIVYHLDADTREEDAAYAKNFEAGYQRIQESDLDIDLLPIIPIKETEAWIWADVEAFKQAIKTKKPTLELGFPSKPHQVEAINKPKEKLNEVISQSLSRKDRRNISEYYEELGRLIDLDQLAQVPAYQTFEGRLRKTLTDLHLI